MKKRLLVAGGGLTGVAAAICAARNGMDVTLVEQSNSLGGAATVNLVNPFMAYWTQKEDGSRDYLSRGFFEELTKEMRSANVLMSNGSTFDEELMKLLLNRMVLAAGVKLLFNCRIISSNMENGKIHSVTVADTAAAIELEADYFIDATGDGNLFALSNVPFELGRSEDGFCQPMTLCFRVGNLHPECSEQFPWNQHQRIQEAYQNYIAAGKIHNPRENVLYFGTTTPTVVHFNTTRVVKMNPLDPWDVTQAEIQAREQAHEIVDMLRREIPGFEDCVLLSTASRIGVRESRRMKGMHMLTAEELKECTVFEDSIAVGNYDIDIHNPAGTGTSHYYFPEGQYYTIPYRSLVPAEGPGNLITAGRCISATHEAQASIRIMPICCCLGQAAGIAAAVAARSDCNFADASVKEIQDVLCREGARIY